ncbi:MAG: GNAT family N-acetyltransferase [Clostridiales bacterium]|nr:GNAT family N-acetyltransferase [Clostridiales bacterium]
MYQIEALFFDKLSSNLRDIWDSLLRKSFEPIFQYEFDLVAAWTEYLKMNWRPFLLIIRENEEPIGIFPLMYREEKRRRLLPFRRIKFLAADNTDFSVILAEERNVEKVVKKSLDWLFSNNLRWELLILDDIVEGSPAVSSVSEWLESSPYHFDYYKFEGKYFFINLDRPWEEIKGEMNKDFVRRNTNLARNRITRAGHWEVVSNPNWDAETIIHKAARIHAKRQAELGRTSSYSDECSRNFIRSVIKVTESRGYLRTYWLKFENNEIAYWIGFEVTNVFYAWNTAFDSKFAHFFPSKLLLFEIVKDCHRRKLKEFNFMRGESDYKEKWTKTFRGNYRFVIKNKSHIYGKTIFFIERLMPRLSLS